MTTPESMVTESLPPHARYSYGGDEFLSVEVSEFMSLTSFAVVSGIAEELDRMAVAGVSDICPANSSLLIRFDPDVVRPSELRSVVETIEQEVRSRSRQTTTCRVVEVPVFYDDPYTAAVGARFRANHQRPDATDLEFAAEINGMADSAEFIERHHSSPWMVTAVGFVAALPFMYQMTDRARQLEVPKYLSPRTDTPALTVGHGGCFSVIYSVRGAGGYQMFGIAPAPVFAPNSPLVDFAESMVLFRPGDIVAFRPIDQAEYDDIVERCAAGTFAYRTASTQFDLAEWTADPEIYNARLMELLNDDSH